MQDSTFTTSIFQQIYLEISLFRNHFNLAIKVFKNLNDLTSHIHRKEKKRKVKPAAFVGGILVGTPTGITKEFRCRLFLRQNSDRIMNQRANIALSLRVNFLVSPIGIFEEFCKGTASGKYSAKLSIWYSIFRVLLCL